MKYNSAFFTLLFLAVITAEAWCQPYYFYTVNDKEGKNQTIYIHDLKTGRERLFLSPFGNAIYLQADDNQERVYLQRHHMLQVYDIKDTAKTSVLVPVCENIGGVVSLDKLGLIYACWTDPANEGMEDEPDYAAVFDAKTMKRIRSLDAGYGVSDGDFTSEDQSIIYSRSYDEARDGICINGFLTRKDSTVSGTLLKDITGTKYSLVEDGEKGDVLISYQHPSTRHENTYFMVHDLSKNYSYPPIHFPYRSHGFILKSRQSVILEQVDYNEKLESAEYKPGNVCVYDYRTGILKKKFSLPPDGELLIYKNFPAFIYYKTKENKILKLEF
ncbi:MAG: hypothetical protein ACM3U0_01720 [archaeon]